MARHWNNENRVKAHELYTTTKSLDSLNFILTATKLSQKITLWFTIQHEMSSAHTRFKTHVSSFVYNEIERRRAVKVGWVNSLAVAVEAAKHRTHSHTSWGKSRKHYTTSLWAKEKTHQRYHMPPLWACACVTQIQPNRRVRRAPPVERPRQKTRGQAESQPKYPWTQPFCCWLFAYM